MNSKRVAAVALAAAISVPLAPAPVEAQPVVPSVNQITTQIQNEIDKFLRSLWAPYTQLITAFPQLKPILDPVVSRILPPLPKPAPKKVGPKTDANSLFAALQQSRTRLDREDLSTGRYSNAPYKRDPKLDQMAHRYATEQANSGYINPRGDSLKGYHNNTLIIYNCYTGRPWVSESGYIDEYPEKTLEQHVREGSITDRILYKDITRAGTAVVHRPGKICSAAVFG